MLRWAIAFFLIAVIASFFGFYNLEGTAMYIARFLAVVFLVLFVISLIFGRRALGGPTV